MVVKSVRMTAPCFTREDCRLSCYRHGVLVYLLLFAVKNAYKPQESTSVDRAVAVRKRLGSMGREEA